MIYNLKEKCHESSDKEFFYGAKINKNIKDVYLGLGFLDPNESDRIEGPGEGHEEILYLVDGQIQIVTPSEKFTLQEGQTYFISDGLKVYLNNLTDKRCYFIIAGGHTVHHSH